MILYNLSKVLGLAGRYDEGVCDEGIRIAKTTGRCLSLPQTMYDRAWAMVKRGRPEIGSRQSSCSIKRISFQR